MGLAGIALLSLTAGYRMRRFTAWLHPEADLDGAGWQLTQGKFALGTGGWWGVGLGGSREKWGALPEAHTDFIFPVIGEELGLFGALTVLGLFAAITIFALRMAIRTPDPFVRITCVGHRRVDRRPGPDQPRRRPAAAADHRRAAAVRLLRRVVAAALA